jgi:alkaline phosphatase D
MQLMAAFAIVGLLGGWGDAFGAEDPGQPAPPAKIRKPKMINLGRYAQFQIMVDGRYFRIGDKTPGSLLGREQMEWLKKELLACKGQFIAMTCGTMWSDDISGGKDSRGQWDRQGREELFDFIEAHRIAGVLLCSGDRHGARVLSIPRSSGFKFYEFEPGSLGKMKGPEAWAGDRTNQLFGVSDVYAFGEFTFDTTPGDPTVEFRLIGDDGNVLFETKLTRSQLTPVGGVAK